LSYALSAMLLLTTLSPPLVYIVGRRSNKAAAGVLCAILAADAFLLLTTLPTVAAGDSYTESYYWIPILGSIFTLFVDGTSLSLSIVTLALMIAATVFSTRYLESEGNNASYYAFLGFLAVGLVGVFVTSCLLAFYFFWELMLIPSYFIIAKWGYSDAHRVAFKFFIFTHAGAVLVILGIGATFMTTNTLDMLQAGTLLLGVPDETVRLILIFFTIGFAVKMAIVPLHMWLPDAHSEAPAPMSALLSGVIIEAGGYAIFRISMRMVYPAVAGTWYGTDFLHALTLLGVFSAYYGALNALASEDIKRIIAYSSISHMGYALFGLSLLSTSTVAGSGALLHLVNHAVSKGLFFLTAGSVMRGTGVRDVRRLGGLASKMPVTAVCSAIAAFSIAGTPGFACFMSEFLMLIGGFQSANLDSFDLIPSALMVVATVLCAAYALRLFWKVFLEKLQVEKAREAPVAMLAPMIILAGLVILLGVWPRLFLDLIVAGK